jgi:threonine/homoserine/homoserine lactone efflux protein
LHQDGREAGMIFWIGLGVFVWIGLVLLGLSVSAAAD